MKKTCVVFGVFGVLAVGLCGCLLCGEKADVVMDPKGPVATPAAALAAARELRASGRIPAGQAVEVCVKAGRYRMTEPVVFTPADSGIHFTGPGFDKAVFDGGETLAPFTARADGIWEAPAPEGPEFEQLWVNGVRAQRARTPNRFYLYMREPAPAQGRQAFYADPADVAPLAALSPAERDRVNIAFWQSWDMGYTGLKAADAKTGLVEIRGAQPGRSFFFWDRTCPRYALENYRAALDAPGEWFLDVTAKKVLYIPRAGETPSKTTAVVPRAPGLVMLAGNRAKGEIVRDVAFRGLGFAYTRWTMGPKGMPNGQSVVAVPDAVIRANGAEEIVIENCRIAHAGAHGVWLRSGCRKSRIRHTLVEDLGAGGVYFGDMRWDRQHPENNPAFLELTDSIVRHGGRTMHGAIGVWIGHAHDCSVVHNEIADFRYTGVSMGWTWGYRETCNRNNHIDFNRIHHIGQGVLSDMGGVYTLGDNDGSTVCRNWIWEVNGYGDNGSPAWGLYTDEGSHGLLLASNLVERCRDGAIHQHYGKENLYANNILATFDRFGVWRSRDEAHVTIRVMNNLFWWNNPEAGTYTGGGPNGALKNLPADGNLYWCTAGAPQAKAFKKVSWEAWRKGGADAQGAIVDPGFVDPAHGDWNLKPDAPARKAGFKPFDWKVAGVLPDDAAWRAKAAERTWDDFEDAPKAPRYLREKLKLDFEGLATGPLRNAMDGLAPFSVSASQGMLAVLDKDVAQGRRALRLTDRKEGVSYQPHINAACAVTGGVAVVRFAYRGIASSGMTFETRDYGAEGQPGFVAGLAVHGGTTSIMAGGKCVCRMKEGQWVDVTLRLPISGPDAGKWSITCQPRGGTAQTTVFPKWNSPRFRELTWVGFMTYGKGDAVWDLDDFELTVEK